MDSLEKLLDYFKKPKEETKNKAPDGLCPLCWGYQEYDHKIRKIFEDDQLDVIHHKKKHMKIRKFLEEHIDGIRLLKGEVEVCPTCGQKSDKTD